MHRPEADISLSLPLLIALYLIFLSQDLDFIGVASLAGQAPETSLSQRSPALGLQTSLALIWGPGDLSSCPQGCMAGTLPANIISPALSHLSLNPMKMRIQNIMGAQSTIPSTVQVWFYKFMSNFCEYIVKKQYSMTKLLCENIKSEHQNSGLY